MPDVNYLNITEATHCFSNSKFFHQKLALFSLALDTKKGLSTSVLQSKLDFNDQSEMVTFTCSLTIYSPRFLLEKRYILIGKNIGIFWHARLFHKLKGYAVSEQILYLIQSQIW